MEINYKPYNNLKFFFVLFRDSYPHIASLFAITMKVYLINLKRLLRDI